MRCLAVVALGLVLATCTPRPLAKTDPPARDSRAPSAAGAPPIDSKRIHALLINGGGHRSSNYQSHVIHLAAVLDVLEEAGVPDDQITIFASDGDDPAADLAVRELVPEGDGWLLEGTRLEAPLGRPMEYVSTQLDGRPLRPATREQITKWFENEGRSLRPGDVLLIYVTDHGTAGKKDPLQNAITLWGKDDSLTVAQLHTLLAGIDPGVRVVALMSQCFSGGFAWLADDPSGLPTGRVCGYFATTDDRPAYGCYPENRGKANVGHSISFLEALAQNGRFGDAHDHTLVDDRTPDVPLRTWDEQAWLLLERAAKRNGQDPTEYADGLLAEAWRDPSRFEKQIRLLDRIGSSFGFASPRSLAEIDKRLDEMPKLIAPLGTHADAWQAAQSDLAQVNLKRFFDENPSWVERTDVKHLNPLEAEAGRELGTELIAELGPSTRRQGHTYQRLTTLHERATTADEVSYRMDVREAALLRMESLLIAIAAEVYLEERATEEERRALDALASCEDLRLDVPHAGEALKAEQSEPFPSWAQDVELARTVMPAWMGIQFRQAPERRRQLYDLSEGAVSVQRVYPESPAQAAGITSGDVILGPPGEHFTEPRQVREWTMLAEIDEARQLDVLHNDKLVKRTIRPGPHPGQFPALPAPPAVGDRAPELQLSDYRSALPASLADGKSHLLFFWATWCVPCKASLPEVAAFARERSVEVVAITDEDRTQLDEFFAHFNGEFPKTVALDEDRTTFLAYGVSGTPTFVLIDGKGIVRSSSTGYAPTKGLGIAGWTWAGRPKTPAGG